MTQAQNGAEGNNPTQQIQQSALGNIANGQFSVDPGSNPYLGQTSGTNPYIGQNP